MLVADIDLDIFLDDVSCLDRRPRQPSNVHPWSEEQLRRFLENQCHLVPSDATKRPKGRFIVHHDEAFPIFEALAGNGTTPLAIAHIDAHSDLGTGFGDLSWMHIGAEFLGIDAKERSGAIPRTGPARISPANYLSFALACRWIASLTYVHHPQAGDDLMPFFFRGFDPECGTIEMRHIPNGIGEVYSKDELRMLPHVIEPEIPFQKVKIAEFRPQAPFDYVILCQSPGYTPVEADALIAVFEEYVDFEIAPWQEIAARQ